MINNSMQTLPSKPTLTEVQEYVCQLEEERSFSHETVLQKTLLLGEEVVELFKAIRKDVKIGIDNNFKSKHIKNELADILILVCCIANRYNFNLDEAFRQKEEIN